MKRKRIRCKECGMVYDASSQHWHTGPFYERPIQITSNDGPAEPGNSADGKDER